MVSVIARLSVCFSRWSYIKTPFKGTRGSMQLKKYQKLRPANPWCSEKNQTSKLTQSNITESKKLFLYKLSKLKNLEVASECSGNFTSERKQIAVNVFWHNCFFFLTLTVFGSNHLKWSQSAYIIFTRGVQLTMNNQRSFHICTKSSVREFFIYLLKRFRIILVTNVTP